MRVALYSRVSTEEQSSAGTIENQLHALREFCERKGYEIAEGGVYKDEGVSGAVPLADRPEGARLLADAAARRFEQVVVYRLDRVARDALQCLLAIEKLKRLKVTIESVNESFDDTASGQFARTVMSAVGELERSLIRERTVAGRLRRVREGKYQASLPPYGYTYDQPTGQLIVNEVEAEHVRDIFTWATAENLGLQAIAARLDKEGVRPPLDGGHPLRRSRYGGWSWSSIGKMLKAPRYMGEGSYGGQLMRCPEIVDPATFQAAQAALTRRKFDATRNRKRFYLLAGLLYCRACGGRYQARAKTTQAGVATLYECGRRKVHGPKAGHQGITWRLSAEEVEPVVKRAVDRLLHDPEAALAEAETIAEQMREGVTAAPGRVAELERRLAELAGQEERMLGGYRRGLFDDHQLAREMAAIADERRALEKELTEARLEAGETADLLSTVDIWIEWVRLRAERGQGPAPGFYDDVTGEPGEPTPEEWRDLIVHAAHRIWVEPDGSLTLEGPGDIVVGIRYR